ncbi:hypothetical protein M0813_20396 [Anaeramoeba flamelloides]|uniref:Uncharacterized protein n=1 Tax=Anaeramoeba flamelloides TaxID=1746091 RepID=A0AAV7YEH9_9EUKA|nr:hypothetical protein M0812_26953 [Anaeramoeba flamelloides]KAJ6245442.1 hypothetical protein M0813_20396 [Anaeramoeba flamelloides]
MFQQTNNQPLEIMQTNGIVYQECEELTQKETFDDTIVTKIEKLCKEKVLNQNTNVSVYDFPEMYNQKYNEECPYKGFKLKKVFYKFNWCDQFDTMGPNLILKKKK